MNASACRTFTAYVDYYGGLHGGVSIMVTRLVADRQIYALVIDIALNVQRSSKH